MGPAFDDTAWIERVAVDNPWLSDGGRGAREWGLWPRRVVVSALSRRLDEPGLIALHGPRRVGKTTAALQALDDALGSGFPRERALRLDFAAPVLDGVALDRLIGGIPEDERSILILDSIHRRPDWEREVAALAGRLPRASVLAISSLRPRDLVSTRMPHLSFREHLAWTGAERELIEPMVFGRSGGPRTVMYAVRDVAELNRRLRAHIGAGGFPETVLSSVPGRDAGRVLRSDLVDTLCRSDLPASDGIGDGGDLTRLLTHLARTTGAETSIERITEIVGSAKNTVRRHLDHLIAAGLIVRLPPIRALGERFQRMRTFKVHLAAPAIHAALFGPPAPDRPIPTALLECAAVAEWLGTADADRLHYARLPEGGVDLAALDPETDRPTWACRLSNDDASVDHPPLGLIRFAELNRPLRRVEATTETATALRVHDGIEVWHRPLAQYCYEVGRRSTDMI